MRIDCLCWVGESHWLCASPEPRIHRSKPVIRHGRDLAISGFQFKPVLYILEVAAQKRTSGLIQMRRAYGGRLSGGSGRFKID